MWGQGFKQKLSSPKLLGFTGESLFSARRNAHKDQCLLPGVSISSGFHRYGWTCMGSLTGTLPLEVSLSNRQQRGGGLWRRCGRSLDEHQGGVANLAPPPTSARARAHTHTLFASSFPSPNDDQSQVRGLTIGDSVSKGLLLELLASEHTHRNTRGRAHTDSHKYAHTPMHTLGTPRGRAAPAASLLRPGENDRQLHE